MLQSNLFSTDIKKDRIKCLHYRAVDRLIDKVCMQFGLLDQVDWTYNRDIHVTVNSRLADTSLLRKPH